MEKIDTTKQWRRMPKLTYFNDDRMHEINISDELELELSKRRERIKICRSKDHCIFIGSSQEIPVVAFPVEYQKRLVVLEEIVDEQKDRVGLTSARAAKDSDML